MTDDHPDLAALRAAVLAAPADDVPRLAFADRLEELDGMTKCGGCAFLKPGASLREYCPDCSGTGRVPNGYAERAEFVRVQVEIARLPLDWRTLKRSQGETKELRMERRAALRKRQQELWETKVGESWVIDYPELKALGPDIHLSLPTDAMARPGATSAFPIVVVRRGFVAHVTCPLAAWLGEPCECVESERQGDPDDPPCPSCRGTGSVGGVAAAVCGSQPVEAVTIVGEGADEWPSERCIAHGRKLAGLSVTDRTPV